MYVYTTEIKVSSSNSLIILESPNFLSIVTQGFNLEVNLISFLRPDIVEISISLLF